MHGTQKNAYVNLLYSSLEIILIILFALGKMHKAINHLHSNLEVSLSATALGNSSFNLPAFEITERAIYLLDLAYTGVKKCICLICFCCVIFAQVLIRVHICDNLHFFPPAVKSISKKASCRLCVQSEIRNKERFTSETSSTDSFHVWYNSYFIAEVITKPVVSTSELTRIIIDLVIILN